MTETTTEETPTTEEQGAVIDAPEGTRACATCGAAVALADDRGPVTAEPGRRGMRIAADGAHYPTGNDTPPALLARCADCAERITQAGRIIVQHPAVGARYGHEIAAERLAGVLDAVAATGARFPHHLGDDPRIVRLLLDRMSTIGAAASWLDAYCAREVTAEQAARAPFSAVPEDVRAEARRHFAVALRYSVARGLPEVSLRAPGRRGCLLCGVGAVAVPATHVVVAGGESAAREAAWTPHTVALHSIGGRPGRARSEGHLCPTCESAAESVGSLGTAAMGRSLAAHLRATGRPDAARDLKRWAREGELAGLLAWAVAGQGARVPASRGPWEHVDLSEVAL